MSNTSVGNIYKLIMDEVIDSSRVDFEEGGVEEGVLEDLRKGWQAKLSGLKIAAFPWDPPPPAPAPAAVAPPTAQASSASQQAGGTYTSAHLSPQSNAPSDWSKNVANGLPGPQHGSGQFIPNTVKPDPAIKEEPGLTNSMPPSASGNVPQYGSVPGGNVAAQRAIGQLQNQYGERAAASISAIQYGQGSQAQRPRPTGPAGQAPPQGANSQAQYNMQMRQQVHAQQQAMMAQQRGAASQHPGQQHSGQQHPGQQHPGQQQPGQQQPGQQHPGQQHLGQQRPMPGQQNPLQHNNPAQNGFQQSQVDGTADEAEFEGVLMRRNENGETSELGRMDIDRMLHKEMASRAKAMEGGGLMLPLKQAIKNKSTARKAAPSGPSAFDGGIDAEVKKEQEELDDEAIGSDLDDPNEVLEDDDDEEIDQIMLCMYDKVQRVKNKWKCTLKDGVMNVNGKDYVFHKATGEYEW